METAINVGNKVEKETVENLIGLFGGLFEIPDSILNNLNNLNKGGG